MSKFTALGHNVLISVEASEEKTTKSGLVLMESSKKEAPSIGVVENLGSAIEESLLKQGVKVLFKKYAGETFRDDDTLVEYVIVDEEDILCTVED